MADDPIRTALEAAAFAAFANGVQFMGINQAAHMFVTLADGKLHAQPIRPFGAD